MVLCLRACLASYPTREGSLSGLGQVRGPDCRKLEGLPAGWPEAPASGTGPINVTCTHSGGTGPYWAHPVVCDGRLYVRHADKLFAYDIRAR